MTDEEKPPPAAHAPLEATERKPSRAERKAAQQKARAERKAAQRESRAERKKARSSRATERKDEDPAAREARRTAAQERKSRRKAIGSLAGSQSAAKPSEPQVAAGGTAKAAQRATKKAAKRVERVSRKAPKSGKALAAEATTDPAGTVKTKEARTARKALGKDTRKQARHSRKADKARTAEPEDEVAKAARKAANKEKRRSAKAERAAVTATETARLDSQEPDRAGKAARKDSNKERKQAKKAERKAARVAQASVAPSPEDEAAKAARRAANKEKKQTAKSERKAAKAAQAAGVMPSPEDEAAKAARKAAKKEKKRAAKSARKTEKDGDDAGPLSPEDEAAEAARKAARKEAKAARKAQRKESGEDDGPKAYRFKVFAPNPQWLTEALSQELAAAGVNAEARDEGKLDLAVHDFDATPDVESYAAAMAKARMHVLIAREIELKPALVTLAGLSGAAIIHAGAKLKRFGATGEDAEHLLADWVLAVANARAKKGKFALPPRRPAPDIAHLRDACGKPAEFLAQIKSGSALAKGLSVRPFQDEVENLADSKIVLSSEVTLPLETPFNWQRDLPDRRSNSTFYGLDFLIGPFAYWYAKAQAQSGEQIKAIDAALKARGKTPNSLLARAMFLVDDFVAKHAREEPSPAWQDQAVMRRVRVLLLYVLCCKAALKRKIAFNEEAFSRVARALFDHIEILRADDRYIAVSQDGIEQDGLLVAIAAALQGLPYAEDLLNDSLTRLRQLQLEPGLTQEGVWKGDSFTEHCGVLAEISSICGDIPASRMALAEPLSAAAKKMTAFAEAMLKCNGEPPGIDDSRQRSYAERLMSARRTLAKAAGKKTAKGRQPLRMRITDTYVFREAQYFISHSSTTVAADSSLVVVHANPPSLARRDPGGITMVFAHGEANLLVRGTPSDDAEDAEAEPALRNGVSIDGQGYREPESNSAAQVRFVKSWRGPGWAAARGIESNHELGAVTRTAIHVKSAHALVVVDELATLDGAAHDFTQHWNLAPEFSAAREEGAAPFRSEERGTLNLAVLPEGSFAASKGEGGTRLDRTLRLSKGVAATLFQWTEQAQPCSVSLETEGQDWSIIAAGSGFSAKILYSAGELRCELAAAG